MSTRDYLHKAKRDAVASSSLLLSQACWDGNADAARDVEGPESSSIVSTSMTTTTLRQQEQDRELRCERARGGPAVIGGRDDDDKGDGDGDEDGESQLLLHPPAPARMMTRGHDPDELGLSWGKRSAPGESVGVVAGSQRATRDEPRNPPPARQRRPLTAADEERRRALRAISTLHEGEAGGDVHGDGGAVRTTTAEERRAALEELIRGGGVMTEGIDAPVPRVYLSALQRQAALEGIIKGSYQ